MKVKTLSRLVISGCASILLAACGTAPEPSTRPPSLGERCSSVMYAAWKDRSLTEDARFAMMSVPRLDDPTTAVLLLAATVTDDKGGPRRIYLRCKFDHNQLLEIRWQSEMTWPLKFDD